MGKHGHLERVSMTHVKVKPASLASEFQDSKYINKGNQRI